MDAWDGVKFLESVYAGKNVISKNGRMDGRGGCDGWADGGGR